MLTACWGFSVATTVPKLARRSRVHVLWPSFVTLSSLSISLTSHSHLTLHLLSSISLSPLLPPSPPSSHLPQPAPLPHGNWPPLHFLPSTDVPYLISRTLPPRHCRLEKAGPSLLLYLYLSISLSSLNPGPELAKNILSSLPAFWLLTTTPPTLLCRPG